MRSQKHFIYIINFLGETKIFLFVHVHMCIAILVTLLKTQQFSFSFLENFNKYGFSGHFVYLKTLVNVDFQDILFSKFENIYVK